VTDQRQRAHGFNASWCGFAADEMLGYIVSMYAQTMGHFVGVFVTVQSARHPAYVQSRITAFLREKQAKALQVYVRSACWYMHVVMSHTARKGNGFPLVIRAQNMTEAEFETQKDSLVEQLSRGHDVCLATYATGAVFAGFDARNGGRFQSFERLGNQLWSPRVERRCFR
jgi:secreted Zn-dependent insulinase-like peptidase